MILLRQNADFVATMEMCVEKLVPNDLAAI